MNVHYAMQVRPEDLDEYDDRWCHGCGRRMDRAPIAGGCDCPAPTAEAGRCHICGGSGTAPETRCSCHPAWLAAVLA